MDTKQSGTVGFGKPDRMLDRRVSETASAEGGFTLVEVLVSIIIGAAAIMAISTLLVLSNRNTSKSRISTTAVSLAQGLADNLRSVRPQDVASVPWALTALTSTAVNPTFNAPFLTDGTNPNRAFVRGYRVDCPVEAGVDLGGDLIQVTVRVMPVSIGSVTGVVHGVAPGAGTNRRTNDLIFYMRDPNVAFIGGGAGLCP